MVVSVEDWLIVCGKRLGAEVQTLSWLLESFP